MSAKMPYFSLYSWFADNKNNNIYEIDFNVEDDPDLEVDASFDSSSPLFPHQRTTSDAPFGFQKVPWTRRLSFLCSLKCFFVFLVICIVAQETAQAYFIRTSELWKKEYGISKELADWLIIGSVLFQGLFSVFIIHASGKHQRINWMSASVILLAVSCISLLISDFYNPLGIENGLTVKDYYNEHQLCVKPSNTTANAFHEGLFSSWLGLIMIVLFQFTLAVCTTCLYIHGAIYIDDHVSVENSILLNGLILALKQMGPSIGHLLSWVSVSTQGTHVFDTPVWIGLAFVLFVAGGFLGMFPNFLSEDYRVKNAIHSADTSFISKDLSSFFKRICQNNVIFLNIMCALFFWAAISNFGLLENDFNQSKFAYPDADLFHTPLRYQAVIAFVRPLILFVSVLCTASYISSNNISAFHVALWSGVAPAFIVLFYFIYIYLGCEQPLMTMSQSQLLENYCPQYCFCEFSRFAPICVSMLKKTFYSPCYAGCTGVIVGEGYMTYTNCTCVTPLQTAFTAISGTCGVSSCHNHWLINDLLQLGISALAVTVLVTQTVINLYCVHYSERKYALAVQFGTIGLFGFGTIRSMYLIVTSLACRYISPTTGECRLFDSTNFSRYVLTLTYALLLLSSLCGLLTAARIRIQTTVDPVSDPNSDPERRHRRRPSMNSSDLLKVIQLTEEDLESDTTPLVFAEIHSARTMDTILEVDEDNFDICRTFELDTDDSLEMMSTDDDENDDDENYDDFYGYAYDDTTPFV